MWVEDGSAYTENHYRQEGYRKGYSDGTKNLVEVFCDKTFTVDAETAKEHLKVAIKTIQKAMPTARLEKLKYAISAIDKQIPKKPILIEDKMYCCPNRGCFNNLLFKYERYPDILNPKTGLRYCLGCGQRIDWEEGDQDEDLEV